ncbi:MAG: hypothetical protein IPM34_00340 [Saprospiraceae bacterium]|nr:hypothetical protein [Saprospiraceae bacterium]
MNEIQYKIGFWVLILGLVTFTIMSIFTQSKLTKAIKEIEKAKDLIDSAQLTIRTIDATVLGLKTQTDLFKTELELYHQKSLKIDSALLGRERDILNKVSGIQKQVDKLQIQRKDILDLLKELPREIETKPLIPNRQ